MMKKTKWWHLMTLILLFAQNVNAQGTGCIPSNGCINTTELVTNGDFALGNLGFQSQLIPSCGQCGAGRYCVGLNELALCNSWAAVPVGPFASATNDNYMIIDASLIPNTIIWSQLVNLNNGEECVREGEYNFKATGKRQYWRLQEMDNCEGGNVVDYVDIYFG